MEIIEAGKCVFCLFLLSFFLSFLCLNCLSINQALPRKCSEAFCRIFASHLFLSFLNIFNCRKEWDVDGDGMIENGGFADQTYDVWIMTGTR